MGIATAVETAPGMGRFLSAPNDLYPWCVLDQVHSGWMRSAFELHPMPLPLRGLLPLLCGLLRWQGSRNLQSANGDLKGDYLIKSLLPENTSSCLEILVL